MQTSISSAPIIEQSQFYLCTRKGVHYYDPKAVVKTNEEKIYQEIPLRIHDKIYAAHKKHEREMLKNHVMPKDTLLAQFKFNGEQRRYTLYPPAILEKIRKDLEPVIQRFNTGQCEGLFDDVLSNVIVRMMQSSYSYLANMLVQIEQLDSSNVLEALKKSKILRSSTYAHIETYSVPRI